MSLLYPNAECLALKNRITAIGCIVIYLTSFKHDFDNQP